MEAQACKNLLDDCVNSAQMEITNTEQALPHISKSQICRLLKKIVECPTTLLNHLQCSCDFCQEQLHKSIIIMYNDMKHHRYDQKCDYQSRPKDKNSSKSIIKLSTLKSLLEGIKISNLTFTVANIFSITTILLLFH